MSRTRISPLSVSATTTRPSLATAMPAGSRIDAAVPMPLANPGCAPASTRRPPSGTISTTRARESVT